MGESSLGTVLVSYDGLIGSEWDGIVLNLKRNEIGNCGRFGRVGRLEICQHGSIGIVFPDKRG